MAVIAVVEEKPLKALFLAYDAIVDGGKSAGGLRRGLHFPVIRLGTPAERVHQVGAGRLRTDRRHGRSVGRFDQATDARRANLDRFPSLPEPIEGGGGNRAFMERLFYFLERRLGPKQAGIEAVGQVGGQEA